MSDYHIFYSVYCSLLLQINRIIKKIRDPLINLFLGDLSSNFEDVFQVGHFFFNAFSDLPDYYGTANAKHSIKKKNDRADIFVKFRG